jgi:hypothetical protein
LAAGALPLLLLLLLLLLSPLLLLLLLPLPPLLLLLPLLLLPRLLCPHRLFCAPCKGRWPTLRSITTQIPWHVPFCGRVPRYWFPGGHRARHGRGLWRARTGGHHQLNTGQGAGRRNRCVRGMVWLGACQAWR